MTYIVAYGGERLDRIAKKLMRTETEGTVEALLTANPGLADLLQSGFVPAGTLIKLPAIYVAQPKASYTLAWE